MDWQQLLDDAYELAGEQRYRAALQKCDRAALASEEARYHSALMRGNILLEIGDPAGALSSFESVADPAVPDPDVDCARGIALFELCKLPEADNALRSAIRGRPTLAEAHYALGLVAELMGTGDEVDAFRQARKIDPARYTHPVPLSREEFQAVLEEALSELPEAVRDAIGQIPVLIAELPHLDDLKRSDPPASPTALGMFVGTPPHEISVMDPPPTEQPTILLFKRNLERAFRDRLTLVAEIGKTILHEVGHALGLSEEELIERGLE